MKLASSFHFSIFLQDRRPIVVLRVDFWAYDPSVSKSNRSHVDIFLSFLHEFEV